MSRLLMRTQWMSRLLMRTHCKLHLLQKCRDRLQYYQWAVPVSTALPLSGVLATTQSGDAEYLSRATTVLCLSYFVLLEYILAHKCTASRWPASMA
jgi:hypothetical protein